MGASFRNIGEIIELAGCDLLTISPNLLAELPTSDGPLDPQARRRRAAAERASRDRMNEETFRSTLHDDAMATEKLAEGIRAFAADSIKLEKLITALQ